MIYQQYVSLQILPKISLETLQDNSSLRSLKNCTTILLQYSYETFEYAPE